MRNTFVPQTGQLPWVAGRPFLSVVGCGLLISLFALHLKQYASVAKLHLLSNPFWNIARGLAVVKGLSGGFCHLAEVNLRPLQRARPLPSAPKRPPARPAQTGLITRSGRHHEPAASYLAIAMRWPSRE